MFRAHHSLLLIADIDGSVFSPEIDHRRQGSLVAFLQATFDVVLLTGRTVGEATALVQEGKTPIPRMGISDLGTSVFWGSRAWLGNFLLPRISPDTHKHVRVVASRCRRLKPQTITDQRLSFIVQADVEDLDAVVAKMERPDVDVRITEPYLDILPKGVNKGSAAQHILEHYAHSYTGVALVGNSENDTHLCADAGDTPTWRYFVRSPQSGAACVDCEDLKIVKGVEDLDRTMRSDISLVERRAQHS